MFDEQILQIMRGTVAPFSRDNPLMVPPRLWAQLKEQKFLDDPFIAERVRKEEPIPR